MWEPNKFEIADDLKMSKKKRGVCVYCGKVAKLERDHVPPRNLFGSVPKANLVTVPCCRACNDQAALDDEYFRRTLVFRHDIGDTRIGAELSEPVYRSLKNPRQAGFAKSFFRTVREVELETEAGIYLGNTFTYDADHERLDNVACRVIKGLFWHHHGNPLPPDYVVYAYCQTGIPKGTKAAETAISFARSVVEENVEHSIDPNIFRYWFKFTDKDPSATGWVLVFFNRIAFIGGAHRPDSDERSFPDDS